MRLVLPCRIDYLARSAKFFFSELQKKVQQIVSSGVNHELLRRRRRRTKQKVSEECVIAH